MALNLTEAIHARIIFGISYCLQQIVSVQGEPSTILSVMNA